MRKFGRILLPLCVLAGTAPALGQHMNAKGAPCQQPGPQFETQKCFLGAADDANAKMIKTYGAIRSFLESEKRTDDRDALMKGQQAWIEYLVTNCSAAAQLYSGGTGAVVTHAACIEANTRQRTEDLKIGYGWLLEKFGHPL